MDEYPNVGEIVVCKVTKILDYGVFVELLEFEDVQGFVHISNVASSWVKNVRNYVKENQIRAGKVVYINKEKKQVDISLNKVNANQQKRRIEDWKKIKRANKLIELIASKASEDANDAWNEIAEPMIDNHGTVYEGLQEIAIKGKDELKAYPAKWKDALWDVVTKHIEPPKRTIQGILTVTSHKPNGVEIIKDALEHGKTCTNDAEIDIYYNGAPKYVIKVTSHSYKVAERVIKFVAKNVSDAMKGDGEATFDRSV